MGRCAIFIDGAYLDCVLRDEFGMARIDYGKLSEQLAGGADLLRTYYYHCLPYQTPQPTPEEAERFSRAQRFYERLSRFPRYQVRLGRLAYRGADAAGAPIFEQKCVDILLGVDLVLLAAKNQISDAILVAGDSDFLPAISIAKDQGVVVHLVHGTKPQPHRELWDAADERSTISPALISAILRT